MVKLCRQINLKLAPSKFSLSTAVKFGGTIISAEKIKENSVIFLDPPDSRILAVTEMERPKTKKDVQKLCGMISSMKPWFPSINFSTDALRKGCSHTSKFIWTPEMELEFEKVKIIFTDQIRLSPFNPDREINILIDGASSAGIGFCFYQNVDDKKPGEEVTIVNANSSALKENQMQYSAVDCKVLELKFATDSKAYYLYGASVINICMDCSAL